MQPFPIKPIPIKRIDRLDQRFNLLPFIEEPSPQLTAAIVNLGLLHPPLLQETDDGRLVIVAGRKRLRVVGDLLKWPSCPCLLIPAGPDPLATLALAMEEALLSGPLSPLSRAILLQKALALCSAQEEVARRFLSRLALPPHALPTILALTTLEQPMALALHEGRLDEKTALVLTSLSFRDRLSVFELIETLQLSVSNQRNVIALCQDLAKRQDSSLHTLLSDQGLRAIIAHPESNLPQKASAVLRYLRELQSPRLTEAEKKFSATVKRLALPKGVALNHSPAFEKDELTLSASFADQAAFDRAWPALSALLTPS